jgi:hypothetical protein
MKLMHERKSSGESPARLVLKTTEYLTSLKGKGAKEKGRKSIIKTQRDPSKPINYTDYKMISLRQFKLREKGRDYHREFKQESERYKMAEGNASPSRKARSKILN